MLALWLVLGFAQSTHAARLALVIGNDQYQTASALKNARHDVRPIEGTLKDAGYEVVGGVRKTGAKKRCGGPLTSLPSGFKAVTSHRIDQSAVNRLGRGWYGVQHTAGDRRKRLERIPELARGHRLGQSAVRVTTPIECHGIRDRLDDAGGLPACQAGVSELTTFTEWRYASFCGQIRVTLESGKDSYSTLLAPLHFLRQWVGSAG